MVEQKKRFEDVILGSGIWHIFVILKIRRLIVKIICPLVAKENNRELLIVRDFYVVAAYQFASISHT